MRLDCDRRLKLEFHGWAHGPAPKETTYKILGGLAAALLATVIIQGRLAAMNDGRGAFHNCVTGVSSETVAVGPEIIAATIGKGSGRQSRESEN
ncbi:MAG: hypothetical protein ACRERV_01915 [Methylococcales bacterium]